MNNKVINSLKNLGLMILGIVVAVLIVLLIMFLVSSVAVLWTYFVSFGAAFFTGYNLIFYYVVFVILILELAFSSGVKHLVGQIKR